MKGRVIALDQIAGRKAAAMLVDGQLDDLLIEAPETAGLVPGTICRAICDRPLKGQGGMMLRLPDGARGFLRQGRGLAPGQPLLVQVTGQAEAGKATPVTTRVLFKSRYAIVTPGAPGINISRRIRDEEVRVRLLEISHAAMGGAEAGLILRSEAADASDDDVAADIVAMRDLALAVTGDAGAAAAELLVDGPDPHLLAWRDWPQPELLDEAPGSFSRHGIDEKISILMDARLALAGGFVAFIEPTRAMVTVDVNTGGDTSPAAGLKANITLARALPRQLRCRGLGGQITVDFAPMPKKDRRQLEQVLTAAFRADPVETALAGWTPLGNFELQRKRERIPLSESLPR